jgi:hypothetical protein
MNERGTLLSTELPVMREPPEVQSPVPAPSTMERVADAAGVSVDVVDAGGREGVFEPEPLRARGPLANSVAARTTGSSEAVHERAADVTSADVPAMRGVDVFERRAVPAVEPRADNTPPGVPPGTLMPGPPPASEPLALVTGEVPREPPPEAIMETIGERTPIPDRSPPRRAGVYYD